MPKIASIDSSPSRNAVDVLLAAGIPGKLIGAHLGFSESQVSRYRSKLYRDRPKYVAALENMKPSLVEIAVMHAAALTHGRHP